MCELCSTIPSTQKACSDPHVAGYIVEPIQGENGVVVPTDGYLKGVREICSRNNVSEPLYKDLLKLLQYLHVGHHSLIASQDMYMRGYQEARCLHCWVYTVGLEGK